MQVAAGGEHSCAVAKAGELYCWGSNAEGQRGDAILRWGVGMSSDLDATSARDASIRTDGGVDPSRFVLAGQRITKVAIGRAHTCTLDDEGLVQCWGRNQEGQVDGLASAAVQIPALVAVDVATDISAGELHSCAVTKAGVECWGNARFGQSGRAVQDTGLPPGLVPETAGAVEVAAGVRHTCARFEDGHVACWGELIDTTSGAPVVMVDPTTVPGIDDATAIAAGAGQTCAIRKTGEVVCWGENESGQLGDGTRMPSATPVTVTGIQHALHVAVGGGTKDGMLVGHSCIVDTDFFVNCWGRNAEGQLGVGIAPDSLRPQLVLSPPGQTDPQYLDSIVNIAAGAFHTCAVDGGGPVRCWGDDMFDQLGSRDRDVIPGRATRVGRFGR